MSDIYEEYGLELEPDNFPAEAYGNPDKPTKEKKRSGGWLKAAIALILGIVIALSSVIGGGFLVLTRPARPVIETIGGLVGLDYEEKVKNKLLSEEYENKTLLEIGKEMLTVITDKNLAGIDRISPAVGDYLDKMIQNMNTQFGVEMDTETVLNTEFAELPTYLGETFRTTPLGNMLKATGGKEQLEPILMEVCYGQEGIHYYIDEETGEVVMIEGHEAATFETFGSSPNSLINNISLAAVLPPDANDSLMLSMAYGRDGVTFQLEKDADGNPVLDANNHPIVNMLPLYFEKKTVDGHDLWTDYTGALIFCTVGEPDANGFQRMEKLAGFEGAGTEIYYVKETYSDGKYYAYKAPADDAEPALFQKTMIGNLAEDSSKLINNIMLKDALKVNYFTEPIPHKILFSLAYGTEGIDYVVNKVDPDNHSTWTIEMINGAQPRTIGDLRERGNDIINDVAMSDIMSAAPTDALGMYLLYGKKDIHYELDASNNITLLDKYIAISDDFSRVYNEYGELLDPAGYTLDTTAKTFTDINGYTYQYSDPDPIKTVTTNDGTGEAKVYYVTDLEGNPVKFRPHSLGELAGSDNLISRLTDRLTLAEILGEANVSSNKFLKHLKDETVNDLPQAISDLTVGQVFEEEIFVVCQQHSGAPVTSIELDPATGNPIMIEDGDWYYEDSNGNLHPSNSEKAIRGTWKYLLTEGGVVRTDYKVATDMNALLTNMTTNVKTATLYDMHNDGVMTFEQDMMKTAIQTTYLGGAIDITDELTAKGIDPTVYPTLGSMPTDKILSFVSILIDALNASP